MKAQELLVAFMEAKAERLSKVCEALGRLYFTDSDRNALLSLDTKTAEAVLSALRHFARKGARGLTVATCPFCLETVAQQGLDPVTNIAYLCCEKCKYAKVHGRCVDYCSDFDRIMEVLTELGIDHTELFDNDFMKSALGVDNTREMAYNYNEQNGGCQTS